MADSLPPISSKWDLYLDQIREHAHLLLAWGYADIRRDLGPDTTEPVITGMLCTAMRSRLNAPGTPDCFLHYWVGDQDPVSPSGELGDERLRLDISVIRTGIKPRLAFVFEAKRLKTNGFPIGKYVGEGGMGDYINCNYAQECPEAAMVALWQDKDSDYWTGELRRVFTADCSGPSPGLGIIRGLEPVTVIEEIKQELDSVHRRSNGTDLRLFHIFLDCR